MCWQQVESGSLGSALPFHAAECVLNGAEDEGCSVFSAGLLAANAA